MLDQPPPGRPELPVPLQRALSGDLAPNVALMHLIAGAAAPMDVEAALDAGRRAATGDCVLRRLQRLTTMWRETPGAFATVKAVLAEVEGNGTASQGAHDGATATLFDRLAALSPDAGAALYALGRDDLLGRATASIVACLGRWRLLGPRADVLDLGCGAGRLARPLAAEVRRVVGVDVSSGMLARARVRCRGIGNAAFRLVDGAGLPGLEDASFDLVVAVDCLPYVVARGCDAARDLLAEARRVLRPGGSIVVFNLSYAHGLDGQRQLAAALADDLGLDVVRNGTRDVCWWDAPTFHMRRPSVTAAWSAHGGEA